MEGAGDRESASLCYMCALDLDKVAKYWKTQLDDANESKGTSDFLALQGFIEKVTIFLKAIEPNSTLESEIADLFSEYAELLSSQGLLTTAASFCRPESRSCDILCDRLYRSKDSHVIQNVLGYVPTFPFEQVNVGVEVVKAQQPTNNSHYAHNQQSSSEYGQPNQQVTSNYQQPSDQLLPGWIALQDPASGNTYYANQNTGETSWDKPVAQPSTQEPIQQTQTEPSSNYESSQMAYNQQPETQFNQPVAQNVSNGHTSQGGQGMLASKYGDGFVSSASHPELGEQYGNITSSNPYSGAERPGTANVTPTSKEAVQEAFDLNDPPPMKPEFQHISDGILSVMNYLSSCVQTSNEKKQLSEIQKGVGIFLVRLSREEIDAALVENMGYFVGAIQNKDFNTANSVQTDMVNNYWRSQKDWLKGMKFLIQLSARKL